MTSPKILHKAKGRHKHHDERSREFAAPPLALPTTSWRHTMGPVLNQGSISGCTGWSGADLLNSAAFKAARVLFNKVQHPGVTPTKYLGNPDGLFIYEQATQNDDLGWTYPPTDQGSTGLGVAKALHKLGAIGGYQWTFDFETMLAYAAKTPVMLGTLWTDAMMEPDAKGVLHLGGDAAIKKADSDGEGHEYCLIGYDVTTKLCEMRNHWTSSWGLKGNALIAATDLETLIIAQHGDVCVPTLVAAAV